MNELFFTPKSNYELRITNYDQLMKDNVLKEKSFIFALNVIQTFRSKMVHPNDYILVKQLIRSATSVGANVEEAIGAHSEREFLMKLTIAYKEARESLYWLRLIEASKILTHEDSDALMGQCDELCRIMAAIQLTIKNKMDRNNS